MLKTILSIVGGVVMVAVTAVIVVKVLANYGHLVVKGCKAADKAIKAGIKKLA